MDKKTLKRSKEWEALLKRHAKPLERGADALKIVVKNKPTSVLQLVKPKKIKSLVTPGGDTAKKPVNVYTGDKMIGISVVHKSCLVPVFSSEEACDLAKMRR